MDSVDRWIAELGYDAVPGTLHRRGEGCSPDEPFAAEMRAMFNETRNISARAFACIDQVPTIALVDRLDLPRNRKAYQECLRVFCERLWNQNLTRVVLVTTPGSFEAWSVDNPRVEPEQVVADNTAAISDWTLSGLLAGRVLRKREAWFEAERRVDRVLLENIQDLVSLMRTERLVAPSLARELIARVIFVSYLEDRHIISDDYRAKHKVGWLYDLLGARDVDGLDHLFIRLQKDFNGDFLKPVAIGSSIWGNLTPQVFDLLHQFLGRTVMRSGQQSFWRYDFSEIPIELIAGIYETFLASKDDEAVDDLDDEPLARALDPRQTPSARAKRKQGAYYTPRTVADAVVAMSFDGRDPTQQLIFDGACGSGMLLTAAFRYLIRARQADAERAGFGENSLGFQARCDILQSQIFGADLDEDACRLTSFSLYLALLSDLAPRDLAVLRAGGHKLPPLANNIRRGAIEGDFFSLASERANKARFSILLSNPPWRKLREGDAAVSSVAGWVMRQGNWKPHVPGREIAAAFTLAASSALAPGGRAALILPINLFLSTERTRREFRGDLLRCFRVERIVNFADMRYLLFSDARHPFVVLLAEVRSSHAQVASLVSENFKYQTPKADIALAFGRLSLHGGDTNMLPASALLDTVPQLALHYWGDAQDYHLLKRLWLHGKIDNLLRDHGWIGGKGFHLIDEDRRRPPETWSVQVPESLKENKFLDARKLTRDLPIIDRLALQDFPYDRIARVPEGEERLFSGPRVLWPDGTNPSKGINAIYTGAPFSFRHSLGVLSAPDDEVGRLTARFIVCYMRSTLGSWLSILLSVSVSAERAKLHMGELADWPFWHVTQHPEPELAWRVLREVDRLLSSVEAAEPLLARTRYAEIHSCLDQLVFDYFGINQDARTSVAELAQVIGPSIQPAGLGYRSLVKPLRIQPSEEDLGRYGRRLAREMRRWRDTTGGVGELKATTWSAARAPVGAAVLEVVVDDAETPGPRVADDSVLDEISEALVRVAGRADGDLFRISNLTLLDGPRILIIKPLVARYWLERSASEDAARIAVGLQSMQPRGEPPLANFEAAYLPELPST